MGEHALCLAFSCIVVFSETVAGLSFETEDVWRVGW